MRAFILSGPVQGQPGGRPAALDDSGSLMVFLRDDQRVQRDDGVAPDEQGIDVDLCDLRVRCGEVAQRDDRLQQRGRQGFADQPDEGRHGAARAARHRPGRAAPAPRREVQRLGGSTADAGDDDGAVAGIADGSEQHLDAPAAPARRRSRGHPCGSAAVATPASSARPTATPSTRALCAGPSTLTTTGKPIRVAASAAARRAGAADRTRGRDAVLGEDRGRVDLGQRPRPGIGSAGGTARGGGTSGANASRAARAATPAPTPRSSARSCSYAYRRSVSDGSAVVTEIAHG